MGADESPLVALLEDSHRDLVHLPPAARRRLYLWLDANAPFYGTYSDEQRRAQQLGHAVAMPRLQ
jgi:hypothetical protein